MSYTSKSPHVSPSPDVLSQQYNDSVVLLNLQTDRFFHLNRTGARFWELLVEGKSLAQIHETMSGEFEVDEDGLTTQMNALIAELRAEELIAVM